LRTEVSLANRSSIDSSFSKTYFERIIRNVETFF